MKRFLLLSAIIFVTTFIVNAQNDTLYIMKAGIVIGKYNVNTEVDSIIFYKPEITINSEPVIETENSITDPRDGNTYKKVTIGNQVWMAENLKYLPSVVGPGTGSLLSPMYYVYNYYGTDVTAAKATENYNTYGVLYNWSALMNGRTSTNEDISTVQGICPQGWHIPSDIEWTTLTDYLGGVSVAGGKSKETGTSLWISPNYNATNENGFSALPGGHRRSTGIFLNINYHGDWWTATENENNKNNAWSRYMNYDDSDLDRSNFGKDLALAVRCVKN